MEERRFYPPWLLVMRMLGTATLLGAVVTLARKNVGPPWLGFVLIGAFFVLRLTAEWTLAVRYPAEGSQELSYPYVLTATNPLMVAAAGKFGALLRSAYAASYVRYAGFRSGRRRGRQLARFVRADQEWPAPAAATDASASRNRTPRLAAAQPGLTRPRPDRHDGRVEPRALPVRRHSCHRCPLLGPAQPPAPPVSGRR